jgi:methylthioribulose 1-phosphate dehydratase / enolase-phosphatase E1
VQGHIWRVGFNSGELKGDLYKDAVEALVEWRKKGIKTYVYSSGSRVAQKNLFGHTTAGDLRPYLSGFFDTTSGPKVTSSTNYSFYASLTCS